MDNIIYQRVLDAASSFYHENHVHHYAHRQDVNDAMDDMASDDEKI